MPLQSDLTQVGGGGDHIIADVVGLACVGVDVNRRKVDDDWDNAGKENRRRRGVPNKKTVKRKQEQAAAGIMPIDLMLANMRFAYGRALELQALADQVADEKTR